MISFRAATKRLRIDVIAKAAVVVTTLPNAASHWLYDNFHPAAVFCDEAARATEPNAWLVLGHYGDVPIVFIGDNAQLVPVILSPPKTNGFAQQLLHGLFPRLKALGHPSAILPEQHRTVPQLSELTSQLFYGGILINSPGTEMTARPMARAVTKFITSEYQVSNTCGILLKFKGTTRKDRTKSLFNENSAIVILDLVEKLLVNDIAKPFEIAVLAYCPSPGLVWSVAR